MPEPVIPIVPEPTIPPVAPVVPDAGAEADEPLGEAGKQALVNERKAAKAAEKRAADAEARIKEFEDRDKSDAQKLQEERDAAVTERDTLRTQTLRRDVADEKGLTAAQAKRLVGTTREELEADADDILATLPVAPAGPKFGDVNQGHRSGGGPTSPAEDFAGFLRQQLGTTK